MKISYDAESDAAYVRLIDGGPNASKQVVVDDADLWKPIVIDLDAEGHVIGFEFMDASEMLSRTLLDGLR